jgi:hypothetical protein
VRKRILRAAPSQLDSDESQGGFLVQLRITLSQRSLARNAGLCEAIRSRLATSENEAAPVLRGLDLA